MARREPIQYRLLPAGRVFAAAGLLLAVAMAIEPVLTTPVLAAWLALATIQVLWPRLALRRIQVRFQPPPRAVRDGEKIGLGIQITNTSAWLRLGPIQIQPALTGRVTPLPGWQVGEVPLPGEARVARVEFGVAVRGRHHAWCEKVETLHPFGLTAASLRTPDQSVPLTVWCARLECAMPDAIGGRKPSARAAAMERRRRLTGQDDRAQLRAYRAGDPMRVIHWRLSARARELIVIERQQKPSPRFWLCVDTLSGGWPHAAQFERMLQVASTLAEDYYRNGVLRGIVLNCRSRRIGDRHSLGIAPDTLASLRHSARGGRRSGKRETGSGAPSRTRIRDILDLLPGAERKVKLVDVHGRTVLEV